MNSVHGDCQGPPTLLCGVTANSRPSPTGPAGSATTFFSFRDQDTFRRGTYAVRHTLLMRLTSSLAPRRLGFSDGFNKDFHHLILRRNPLFTRTAYKPSTPHDV